MKGIFFLIALISAGMHAIAQTETFDLVTCTPPKGWTKETLDNVVGYTSIDSKKKTWCRIAVFKSMTSKGAIESDFESEWNMLVAEPYKVTDAPQASEVAEADGWKIKAAIDKFIFDNANAIAMVTTFSGHGRCVSIMATTNSEDYLAAVQSFIGSVSLKKPTPVSASPANENTISSNNSVIGTWQKTSTNNSSYEMNNGLHGYFQCQYIFKKDGTYSFISRVFNYLPDILFAKENGTYKVTGNTVVLTPQNSIIQKWSKGYIIEAGGRKAYVDKLGKLISSQKRPLQKTTYQFTREYMSGIQEWNLMLVAEKETLRDGAFNGGSYYKNTWFYKSVTSDKFLVKTD